MADEVRPQDFAAAGVTEREAEVLWLVAGRLHNREIAERLFISIRTVESHVSALLRKLSAPDRAALVELGRRLDSERRARRHDLPVPLTSFVGRERETAEVVELLGRSRLVTITGTGGSGKTRLGLRVAAKVADSYRDGARLVDLATVTSNSLVLETIARAFGVREQPGEAIVDALRGALRDARCLLVLDNCEHVVGEVARRVADLLGVGAHLRVLATSREPLGVPGEVAYRVGPMQAPEQGALTEAAGAQSYEAVRLFAERAASARPGFRLTDANAAAIADICRRLDGLPLAIELAASRMRGLSPDQLLSNLDDRFELLTTGPRTVAPRQRGLRATIDWSYDLLEEDERVLFARLAVFHGSFDYDAAEAVCADEAVDRFAVMRLFPSLLDKSLVSVQHAEAVGVRYRLLESLREYAAERLAERGDLASFREQHATHYLRMAEDARPHLSGSGQRAWLARLIAEQTNLDAAMSWTIEAGDGNAALRFISALMRLWEDTGQRREAHGWIDRTLAVAELAPTEVTVGALGDASYLLHPWDLDEALRLAESALELSSGLGAWARAHSLQALGWAHLGRDELDLAVPALREAISLLGQDEHPWERAQALQGLGMALPELIPALERLGESASLFERCGDRMKVTNVLYTMAYRAVDAGKELARAQAWLEKSLALSEDLDSSHDRAHALLQLGRLADLHGDRERAEALVGECAPTFERLGDRRCAGRALRLLGESARTRDELGRATELLHRSVRAAEAVADHPTLVGALDGLADIAVAEERPHDAALLFGTSEAQRRAVHPSRRPERKLDQTRLRVRQQLGPAMYDAALDEGGGLSPGQALHRTTSVLSTDALVSTRRHA